MTQNDSELIRRLLAGAKVWNVWREQHESEPVDLMGADLGGANLASANLIERDTLPT